MPANSVNDYLSGTGDLVDDYPSYPTLADGAAPPDTDGDAMPDAWETAHGLDPSDPSDGPKLASDGSGYTNVEQYLNSL